MNFRISNLTVQVHAAFICLFFFPCTLCANQNDENVYYVPSFRAGHNLSLFLSGESTTWSANQLSSPNANESIASANESKAVMALFFRYSYHINIISSFGFFVGSTTGFLLSNGSYGKDKNFYPGIGVSFPTVMSGFVQGIGQDFRILTGIEYGAVWFPKMYIKTMSDSEKELSPVPDMINIFLGLDNFFSHNTALTVNLGYRQIKSPCLNSCSSSIYLNSLSLTSKSYYGQLGITWVVGELSGGL